MSTLLSIGMGNALAAAVLAPLVALLARVARRPALAHGLWLLVLLRLILPSPATVAVAPPRVPEPPPAVAEPVAVEAVEPSAEPEPVPGPPPIVVMEPAAWAWPSWRAVLLSAWAAGSLGWSLLAARRIRRFARVLRWAEPAPAGLQGTCDALAQRLGLKRGPRVVLVPGPVSPLVWALGGRARLVVPGDLWGRLDDDQREALLLHELAHLRRRDHWLRPLELLATGLYWWHPALWWARRGLRDAEEQCCDAWVVWARPDAARSYATALVEAVDFLSAARPALPLGASGMGRVAQLSRRITMVMRGSTPRALSRPGTLALLGLAALLLTWRPVWSQDEPKPEPPKPKEAAPADSDAKAARDLADAQRRRAEDRRAWAEEMYKRGYLSARQRDAAGAGVKDEPDRRDADASDLDPADRVATATRALQRAQSQLKYTEAAYKRYKKLVEVGAVAEGELRSSQAEFERAGVDLESAEAQVARAQRGLVEGRERAREAVEILETQAEVKRAQLDRAQAQLEIARAGEANTKKLAERNVVSSSEAQRAHAESEVARASVDEAKAALRESQVRLRQAQRRLNALSQPVVPKAATEDPPKAEPAADPARRIRELEQELDRLRKEVEGLRRDRPAAEDHKAKDTPSFDTRSAPAQ